MIQRLRARNEWIFFSVLPDADRLLAFAWWSVLLVLVANVWVLSAMAASALSGDLALGPLATYAAAAGSGRAEAPDGRITLLVSHRFSTVRMADLIVVMNGARVVEVGSHEDLLAGGGQYAELYGIQASAYS
jgi:hypothetical protein